MVFCTVAVDRTVEEQLVFSQTGVVLLGVVRTGGGLEEARSPVFPCARDGGDPLVPLGLRVFVSFRRGRVCCVLAGASPTVVLGTLVSVILAPD